MFIVQTAAAMTYHDDRAHTLVTDRVWDHDHDRWTYTVIDQRDGSRWWPSEPVVEEGEALRLCEEEPGRGRWSS